MHRHWHRHSRNAARGANDTASLFAPLPSQRRLSNPNDDQAFGTLRALGRALTECGSSFDQLAGIIESHWHQPDAVVVDINASKKPKKQQEWQAEATELLRTHADVLIVSDKINEPDFLTNISRQRSAPSELQEKWMGDIKNRIPQLQHASSFKGRSWSKRLPPLCDPRPFVAIIEEDAWN